MLTDRCVVIGCLLINLMMLIDTYRSMIVRFAAPATRGFLLPLLSPSLYPGPRGFILSQGEYQVTGKEAARENLWGGYPRCESHFHATIAVNQHHEID